MKGAQKIHLHFQDHAGTENTIGASPHRQLRRGAPVWLTLRCPFPEHFEKDQPPCLSMQLLLIFCVVLLRNKKAEHRKEQSSNSWNSPPAFGRLCPHPGRARGDGRLLSCRSASRARTLTALCHPKKRTLTLEQT